MTPQENLQDIADHSIFIDIDILLTHPPKPLKNFLIIDEFLKLLAPHGLLSIQSSLREGRKFNTIHSLVSQHFSDFSMDINPPLSKALHKKDPQMIESFMLMDDIFIDIDLLLTERSKTQPYIVVLDEMGYYFSSTSHQLFGLARSIGCSMTIPNIGPESLSGL